MQAKPGPLPVAQPLSAVTAATPAMAAFVARKDLSKYGRNGLLLYAAQLRFQIDDVDTFAATSLTDGPDDKKCDLVMVDRDRRLALVAQSYIAEDETRPEAPANKASDMNTAVAWVLTQPLAEVPQHLQSAVKELRAAIADNQIDDLLFWYVHNLPESGNVKKELDAVVQNANAALKAQYAGKVKAVYAQEVGRGRLDEFYQRLQTNILVADPQTVVVPGGILLKGDKWSAYTTAVPVRWLHGLFKTHQDRLFSANVRDYLGSRKSDSNINYGIKSTAETEPDNFWVYNNGITAVVNGMKPMPLEDGTVKLDLEGISIVNGAQTTGAIGSLKDPPAESARVGIRFVKCDDPETLGAIIRFNNSQNKIEAADFRSNDAIQKRLRQEFSQIPGVRYLGGRRGGADDIIRRPGDLLPSNEAAQALMAFHQSPVVAYNEKSQIWESDSYYTKIFNDRTRARHIVFCYSLLKSIEAKKLLLVEQEKKGQLTGSASDQLSFLRSRGAVFLLVAALAKAMETLAGRKIPDPFATSFGNLGQIAAETAWAPILDCVLPLTQPLTTSLQDGLKNADTVAKSIKDFVGFVEATKAVNASIYAAFAGKLVFD